MDDIINMLLHYCCHRPTSILSLDDIILLKRTKKNKYVKNNILLSSHLIIYVFKLKKWMRGITLV